MSRFINVGVRDVSTNADFATKKSLKERLAVYPQTVEFYITDAFGENAGKSVIGDSLDSSYIYTVTGPNPYTSRKWYASVTVDQNGKIKVQ